MNLGIYGTGGLGKEIFDVASRQNEKSKKWESIFFIDDFKENDTLFYLSKVFTLPYVIANHSVENVEVVIAIGEPIVRIRIKEKLKQINIKLGSVIDPSAIISPTATLCDGVIVTSDCIIASSAYVGENVVINVKSIVGHDIIIYNDVVISSMVNIGGACKIGAGTYLGMGCLIKEGLEIGEEVIIGMSSAVHHNIPNRMIALGNPARPMRENIDKKVFK
jgi:sugar O-acyltransferase (sialic acid O-acetyltransferase NeuD family)